MLPTFGLRLAACLFVFASAPLAPAAVQCNDTLIAVPPTTPGAGYGRAAAVHHETAAFGAPGDGIAGTNAGAASIYRRSGVTWLHEATVRAIDAGANHSFGIAVALWEDTLFVGATGAAGNTVGTGAVYVFKRNGSTWSQTAKLYASDGHAGSLFGRSVSIHDDILVVGAPADAQQGWNAGAAYVFRRSPDGWVQTQKLVASNPSPNDVFGLTVAVHGTTIAAGAPKADHANPADPNWDSGTVYVFERQGASWIERARLQASNAGFDDLFGIGLDAGLDHLAMGAIVDRAGKHDMGAAYVFRRDTKGTESKHDDTWDEIAYIEPHDGQANDVFGTSVSISGGRLIVGAERHSAGGPNAGAVYVYQRLPPLGNQWRLEAKWVGTTPGGRMGGAVALRDARAAVGRPGLGGSTGGGSLHCFLRRVFVTAAAQATTSNGSSWATAYRHLQDALMAAVPGDEIWVAGGVYRPDQGKWVTPLDRHATFHLLSGVRLYGGFVGHETSLEQRPKNFSSILSGDLAGNDGPKFTGMEENSIHVVTGTGADRSALLDGFVVRDGNADLGVGPLDSGAGINNRAGSATIRNCLIMRNSAGAFGNGGGGAYNRESKANYIDCTFYANRNVELGGAAMWNQASDVTLVNCRFLGNLAPLGSGAAIANRSSRLTAFNCEFSGNKSGSDGGAIFQLAGSTAILVNCTFANNEAGGSGGATRNHNAALDAILLRNSIVFHNKDGSGSSDVAQLGGPVQIDRCVVENWSGTLPGNDVVAGDPRFRMPIGPDGIAGTLDDDLRLAVGSYAIDAGDVGFQPVPLFDPIGDGVLAGAFVRDINGLPRITDDPMVPGTGPSGSHIDIGAHERAVLSSEMDTMSASAGGEQPFLVDAGSEWAGWSFLFLGSASGTSPGIDLGPMTLPLAVDAWFDFLIGPGFDAVLKPQTGVLDIRGKAKARASLTGPLPVGAVGLELHHAVVVFRPDATLAGTTNAVALRILP